MSKVKQVYLSDDVRKQNRLRLISQFRISGEKSRTELSKVTELSPGTVTNVTLTLLDDGIINSQQSASIGQRGKGQGRPRVLLNLNPEYKFVVAGSLTFNTLSLSLFNYKGKKITCVQKQLDLGAMTAWEIAQQILSVSDELGAPKEPSIFVIGVQGLVANEGNEILWSPILSDSGRAFVDELSLISEAKVIVANDSAMIARSLSRLSQNREKTFAAVLMSYGIGLGLYIDGNAFHGARSSASELGHIPYRRLDGPLCRCGKKGCVEAYAGDYAIWRRANGYASDEMPNIQITSKDILDIIHAAKQSDGLARRAFEEAGEAMGYGLATMFSLFDVFPVTFVGRGAQGLDLMETALRRSLAENFRFQKQRDVAFSKDSNALSHVEIGCSIIGLELLDQQAAFGN